MRYRMHESRIVEGFMVGATSYRRFYGAQEEAKKNVSGAGTE